MLEVVKAKNFLSWEELSYDIIPGVGLIDGWNEDDHCSEGSGKSSILNAICWGSYGKIPKDTNIDDVIREGSKSCSVILHFNDGFTVTRTRNPNDLYYALERNGEPCRGSSATDTQKLIVEKLGLSFEAFVNTVYQSQAKHSQFIQAPQEKKLAVLTEIVDLSIFDRARKHTFELYKTSDTICSKKKQELALLQGRQQLVENSIVLEKERKQRATDNKKATSKALQEEYNHATSQVADAKLSCLEEQMERDVSVKEKKTDLINTGDEVRLLNLEHLVKVREGDVLKSTLQSPTYIKLLEEELIKLKVSVSSIDQTKKYHGQQKEVADSLREALKLDKANMVVLRDFIKNPNKTCPTCGSTLKNCNTEQASKELAALEKITLQNEESLRGIEIILSEEIPYPNKLNTRISEINVELAASKQTLDFYNLTYKPKLQKSTYDISALIARKGVLEADLKALESKPPPNLQEALKPLLLEQHEALTKRLDFDKQPLDWSDKKLVEYKAKKTSLKASNNETRVALEQANIHLNSLEELKIAFKNIKAYIFEGLLQELNTRTEYYLTRLFEVGVSIKFKRVGKDIETFVELNSKPRKLGLLSGGQYKRFSLAVDLALNDLVEQRRGSKFGFICLDEYFTGLSEESMEKCLILLKKLKRPVILIEHNTIFKSIVDRTFFVNLKNGVSTTSEG